MSRAGGRDDDSYTKQVWLSETAILGHEADEPDAPDRVSSTAARDRTLPKLLQTLPKFSPEHPRPPWVALVQFILKTRGFI